jgi:hypothetical protein
LVAVVESSEEQNFAQIVKLWRAKENNYFFRHLEVFAGERMSSLSTVKHVQRVEIKMPCEYLWFVLSWQLFSREFLEVRWFDPLGREIHINKLRG